MATDIILPKIGFSMTEGVLAEWLVADGATVTEGQPIFSLESDKSTNEVESPAAGVIKITGVAGETYEVGAIIGTIG
jgi:pyruvate/2-oxoglutarate dehydrogenase complex dihydrolipoamide acyltransferase (E2) component